jgi:hypothetical protein
VHDVFPYEPARRFAHRQVDVQPPDVHPEAVR